MCVLRTEVLQNLLVATIVDVVAVDLLDDLTGLKARSCCLPACSVSIRREVKGQKSESPTIYDTHLAHAPFVSVRIAVSQPLGPTRH